MPHTPSPWTTYKGEITGPESQVIVEEVSSDVTISKATARANARLIASAPDLLAALQKINHILTASSQLRAKMYAAREVAFKAIAKAT